MQDGPKIKLQTLVHFFTKYWWFFRLIFHKVGSQGMVYLVTGLLQIFHRMCRWKKFENRSIFCEDMDKSLRLTFLGHPVCYVTWYGQSDRETLRDFWSVCFYLCINVSHFHKLIFRATRWSGYEMQLFVWSGSLELWVWSGRSRNLDPWLKR